MHNWQKYKYEKNYTKPKKKNNVFNIFPYV